MMSQSGALGLSVIARAADLRLGVSQFVSVGNNADVSGNDLLAYWAEDPKTELILMYLESFGNPRKFSRLARRVARQKPIVAVKSGRSIAGPQATSSHTGALLAASDVTVDALFKQAGVIRTDTLAELFDLAQLLSRQPAPTGNRVGVITNAGGPGSLCADACEAAGLNVRQPLELRATAPPADYAAAITAMAQSNEVDAIIAIAIPMLGTSKMKLAAAIEEAAAGVVGPPTVLAVMMSGVRSPVLGSSPSGAGTVPWYKYPEDAARPRTCDRVRSLALGSARRRTRPSGDRPRPCRGDHRVSPGSHRGVAGQARGCRSLGCIRHHGGTRGRATSERRSLNTHRALRRCATFKTAAVGYLLGPSSALQKVTSTPFKKILIQPMVPPAPELILGMCSHP